MERIKKVFYKDKWREVIIKKTGKKTDKIDTTRLANCVRYKGKMITLTDDFMSNAKVRYE